MNHIGRAGRDGFTSRCILLYSNSWWTQLFEDGRAFTKELGIPVFHDSHASDGPVW